MAAFRRIVESGMKGAPIHPMDLLTVRSCGQRVVETYRKKALEVGLQGGLLSCILAVLSCWAGLTSPRGTIVTRNNHGLMPAARPTGACGCSCLVGQQLSLQYSAGTQLMAKVQEGDNAFRDLEYQALAQAKGAAGLEPSLEAMHQVFGHEGDVILTRCPAARHFQPKTYCETLQPN